MAIDVQLDPRGVRFGAAVSLLVALVAVVLGPTLAGLLVTAALALLFVPGAIWGPQSTVQAALFKTFIRPRLNAPTETESSLPPRFAQQVGLVCAGVALVFGLVGLPVGFFVGAGFVVVASFLNAVFGLCLGCEVYVGFKRLVAAR